MTKTATLQIETLSHEGRGIAHLNGKTIFIDNALPSEEVTIELKKRRRKWDEAKVIEVITPASTRVEPSCAVYGICGGCSLQHMDHQAQIAFKEKVVLEQVQHLANTQPKTVLPAIFDHPLGYRRKARLGVRYVYKKEKVLVGFRERQGRYLTDTKACDILHDSVGKKLQELQLMISELKAYQHIAQIEVAVGDNATALVFRNLESLDDADISLLKAFGQAHNFWIYLQPGGEDTVHRIYPTADPHSEKEYLSYRLTEQNLELLFKPMDFTQVNQAVNQKMVISALNLLALQPNETVLDLFCGLGNFSLAMAQQCQKVVAVEGSDAMVERGGMNAKHNKLSNIEFYQADLMADIVIGPFEGGVSMTMTS